MSAAGEKKRGLGRGLDSLLGDAIRDRPSNDTPVAPDQSSVRLLPIADLKPHPDQPRRHFAQTALEELAQSIRERGIIQPIVVRPAPSGKGYQIVAGERRWRAAQRAALHEIPAIIRDFGDSETLEIALIENVQREDLNPIEEAEAYHRLTEDFGHSQKALAALVDKSRSHVANLMRLLDLPNSVRALMLENRLQMGHARALIGFDDAEGLAHRIERDGLTVRDVEKIVRQSKGGAEPRRRASTNSPKSDDPDIKALETQLSDLLGLDVAIASEGSSGRMTIRYGSLDQLDMLCQRLSGGDF
ncbi:ParB/RepB/Spo0J family partition protein [Novosphingopyxis baekryungensis]|uniref:ParB/RepB/Spo0J family partition protein n=1 Tax=Novosphingopyxis baekryungensis TaxID=279369 RepID=UPI0003B3BAA4|nr:ParB/RepB/Spo0J family partition protein [Novosphingopyxis baekryungensis]